MQKREISTIAEKNRIISNIINAMVNRDNFLVLGHQNPDEDCLASMIAVSLLLTKFSKKVKIFASDQLHEHFDYLLSICKFNSIGIARNSHQVGNGIDTIIVCDTPKRSMVSYTDAIAEMFSRPEIVKIEVDHHLQSDSEYIGDPDFCLVDEASSACELVGLISLKMQERTELLEQHQVVDLLSRNFVLAVLTGIIGDTNMGKFIKSRRERRFYEIFSNMFNELLSRKTKKGSNFSNKDEVFHELHRLSAKEEECFNYMMSRKQFSDSIGYSILTAEDMRHLHSRFDRDTIVAVARATADALAEASGILSLVVYNDDTEGDGLVQFRARRSQDFRDFDLRKILSIFGIENGGGHQGAIGFRVEQSRIGNLVEYVGMIVSGIETALRDATRV